MIVIFIFRYLQVILKKWQVRNISVFECLYSEMEKILLKKTPGMDGKVCTPVSHPGEGGDFQADRPVLCHCSVSKHSLDGAEGTDQRHLCSGRREEEDIHVDLQRKQEVTHF